MMRRNSFAVSLTVGGAVLFLAVIFLNEQFPRLNVGPVTFIDKERFFFNFIPYIRSERDGGRFVALFNQIIVSDHVITISDSGELWMDTKYYGAVPPGSLLAYKSGRLWLEGEVRKQKEVVGIGLDSYFPVADYGFKEGGITFTVAPANGHRISRTFLGSEIVSGVTSIRLEKGRAFVWGREIGRVDDIVSVKVFFDIVYVTYRGANGRRFRF